LHFAFVTDELPRPGLAGHLALNHAIIRWLRDAGHDVTIFLVRPRLRLPVERYELAPVAGPGICLWGDRIIAVHPRDATAILVKYAIGLLPNAAREALRRFGQTQKYGKADTILGSFITPRQSRWCAVRIAKLAPDAVLVDTIFRAPILLESELHGLNSIIIAHAVFFLRHRALVSAGYAVRPALLIRHIESALLNNANTIAAIQPAKAAVIRSMCPDRQVCTTPMPAVPCVRPVETAKLPDHLVFVGSASLPNLDGLRWFFSEVWPRLRTWRVTITLDLVGDCGAAFAQAPPGVTRLGRVKNLSGILHRSALAISPLRVGSGLKIKLLDYARHGLVTVATPESLHGVAAGPNAPFIAASDAVAFASVIAEKLQYADNVGEQQALDYIATHYSFETSFSGLTTALRLPAKIKDTKFA
jgi:hypothetical protein